jgi:hypothetical protein
MRIPSISAPLTAIAALLSSAGLLSSATTWGSPPPTTTTTPAPSPPAAFRGDGAAIVLGAGRIHDNGAEVWRDAGTGDVLPGGTTVQASPDQPMEMTLPDGVTVALEPGATIKWERPTKLPSETNHFTRGYYLWLEDGEIEVRMPPGPKGQHAFLVSTRAGTLTDWRGQIHIMSHGDTTAAAIYAGALVVGTNGQGFPVYDGAGILIRKGVNPEKSRGIPAVPTWVGAHAALELVGEGTRPTLDLTWRPVPNAENYRVELATDPAMAHVVSRASVTEAHDAALDPAAGGRYWSRVRAVDAKGIVGEWSAVEPMRVVHYALPDGGFVASDGAVVVPADASVRLLDADGLQVAYEGVGTPALRAPSRLYWYGVSGPLKLSEDAPARIVHLRDPSLVPTSPTAPTVLASLAAPASAPGVVASDPSHDASGEPAAPEARLLLARRELRADVELAPKTARWPSDAIDARVVVRDPSGRISGATAPVTLEALLDLTPLPVDWQRRGDTWTGRISPRTLAGPSVIRVRVLDEKGSEIGRGFVEIGDH